MATLLDTVSPKLLEAAYAFDLDEVARLVRNGVRNEAAFLSDLGGTLQADEPATEAIFAQLRVRGFDVTNEKEALFELYRTLLQAGHEVPDGSSRRCVVRVVFGATASRFSQAAPLMTKCIEQDMLDWSTSSWAHQLQVDRDDGKTVGRTILDSPHDLLAEAVGELAEKGNMAGLKKVCMLLPKEQAKLRKWLSGSSSPLCKAAAAGQIEPVRFLLALMPEPAWRNVGWGGKSAFHTAALTGQAEVVRMMMDEHGCSLQDPGCGDLIAGAIQNRRRSIVPVLLAWGCDPNNVSQNEPTGLHLAIWMGYEELVAPLIAAGNAIEALDKAEMTPLLVAGMVGMATAVAPLVQAGAMLEAVDKNGKTALAWACGNDRLETTQALVQAGASLDTPNKEAITPRECAKGQTRAWVWEGGLENSLPVAAHRSNTPRF